jgi:hypothetical protein
MKSLLPTHDIDIDEAQRLQATKWWHGHSVVDIAMAQARQPRLCMPFGEFRAACEAVIGEPLSDIAFTNPEGLVRMLEQAVQR